MPILKTSTPELAQEFFHILKQVARIKWELTPVKGIKQNESELLGFLHLNLDNGTETIPASEISKQLNITPGAVTHMLNPLEHMGLIRRHKHHQDRRFVLIGLTIRGRNVARELINETYQSLQDPIRLLGESEIRQTIQLLGSLVEYYYEKPLGNK